MTVRSVEDRIRWFDSHRPDAVGRCAEYTHESFGGLPLWHAPDANAVVTKAKQAGVLHTDEHPPRGAIVLYTSRTHGHMCLSLGGGRIISTDYPRARDTGEAVLSMPRTKWGHRYAGWLDTYAGVRFSVGSGGASGPSVNLANLHYGKRHQDVEDLQRALNKHLSGDDLPVTGFYGDQTDAKVRQCQQAHDLGDDRAKHSSVGPRQAAHLGLVVS
jgi:hypothetical protein